MSATNVLSARTSPVAVQWDDEAACELATIIQCGNQPPVAALVGDVTDQGFRLTTREPLEVGALVGVDLAAGATDMGHVRVRVVESGELPDGLWRQQCVIVEDEAPATLDNLSPPTRCD